MPDPQTYQLHLPCPQPRSREEFFASTIYGPRLAIGTAAMNNGTPDGIEALHAAWSEGFLLTDTSPRYGEAENLVGGALRTWHGRPPLLATKCGMENEGKSWDFTGAALAERYDRSRRRLGRNVDYLAIHEPDMCPPEHRESCWSFLHGLLDRGEIRAVGLGGGGPVAQRQWFSFAQCLNYVIVHNRLSAVTLQGLVDSIPLCRQYHTAVWLGSPLMMGLLGNRLDYYRRRIGESTDAHPRVLVQRAGEIERLAAQAGLPPPQLALRFALSLTEVDLVVSGAATTQQWADSLAAYRAGPLPQDLFARVWSVAQQGEEPYYGG